MATANTFDASLLVDGREVAVRVVRDSGGELHLGSPEDTSLVEQLLVYDLGEDADECERLAAELRSVGTGQAPARTRAWNVTRIDIGPVESSIGALFAGEATPSTVATRALHGVVERFRAFLAATDPA